ncbi:MAG: family 20 glycosylhydrolase [Clostridia bacterium]|nr:family 20 glycosylhydrolase [Clostridia bacterium]
MKISEVQIIPTPKKVLGDGEEYEINICAISEYAPFEEKAELFRQCFGKIHNIPIEKGFGGLELCFDENIKNGAYRIVSDGKMKLYASDDEGMGYAVASALLLINVRKGKAYAQNLTVDDYADKDYRSLMISLAKEGIITKEDMSIEKIKNFIDICFLFKVKYLHLHFSDNTYYAFPSKVLPNLPTEENAYTFEEIKEMNSYAKMRGIILVPELDLPGHAEVLTARCPEVFANDYDSNSDAVMYTEAGLAISWDELICVGSKTSMEYIMKLIDEICEMFPDSPYIHLGGDEADIEAWNSCSACRQYMKDENIEDVHELYSDFIGRVCTRVLENGRTPIVWEGFPKNGIERIPKETIVCAWECYYHQPEDLLDAGFRIINGSWKPLYIVPTQTERWTPLDIMKWDVYNLQHFWPESRAHLNPVHLEPTDKMLGAQVSVWRCTYELCISRVIENISAFCERVWNVERVCNDEEFVKKHYIATLKAGKLIVKK